jgi:hypothetical protein
MDLYTNVAQEVAAEAARKLAGAIPWKVLRPAGTLGLRRGHPPVNRYKVGPVWRRGDRTDPAGGRWR